MDSVHTVYTIQRDSDLSREVRLLRGHTRNAIWRLRNETKREGRKVTQYDVAVFVGVPRSRISQFENGWILPTRTELDRIAEFFGVIPEQLYSRTVIEAIDEMEMLE